MKKIFGWFVALLLLTSVCYAEAHVIYEYEFYRDTSIPAVQTEIFEVLSSGPAVLKVYNGDMRDVTVEKVSSAIIKINEEIIFDSSNFNQNVNVIDAIINLIGGENTLTVDLKGKPGGKLTIKIENATEGNLDSFGGTVEVTDVENPIAGAKVDIPEDVLPVDQEVVIIIAATEVPEPLTEEFYQAGENVNIIATVEQFSEPVLLSIPYNDKDNDGTIDGTTISEIRVGVKYFNGTEWENVPVISRNSVSNTVTVETTHFSNYVTFAKIGDTPNYHETPVTNGAIITIDGDPSDWIAAGLILAESDPSDLDPQDDCLCGVDTTNIKQIYTAIDDTYAYLLFETYESISPNAIVRVDVNYKFGDRDREMPYTDMFMIFNTDGSVRFYDRFDNGLMPDKTYEVSRGQALEFKIPLSEIEDAEFFNFIEADIRLEDSGQLCDSYLFNSYIFFVARTKHFEDGTEGGFSQSSIVFQFYNELSDMVNYRVLLDSVTLTDITDPNNPIETDLTNLYTTMKSGYLYGSDSGGWDDSFDLGYDYGCSLPPLSAGKYLLRVIDITGNTYEREYEFPGDNNSLPQEYYPNPDNGTLYFDVDGNLRASWESNDHDDLTFRLYVFNEGIHPVTYRDKPELNFESDFTSLWYMGYLDSNYVMIPKNKIIQLVGKIDELYDGRSESGLLSFGFRVRTIDRSNEWFPYIDKFIPLENIPGYSPDFF